MKKNQRVNEAWWVCLACRSTTLEFNNDVVQNLDKQHKNHWQIYGRAYLSFYKVQPHKLSFWVVETSTSFFFCSSLTAVGVSAGASMAESGSFFSSDSNSFAACKFFEGIRMAGQWCL